MIKKRIKSDICPNCGNPLAGDHNFCSHCGQENHNPRLPVGKVLFEFVENNYNLDSRLYKTLQYLFLKPGQLTLAYINNQRQKYVSPAKIYLFASFIFFFVLSLSVRITNQVSVRTPDENALIPDSVRENNLSVSFGSSHFFSKAELTNMLKYQPLTDEIIDSIYRCNGVPEPGWMDRKVLRLNLKLASGQLTLGDIISSFIRNVSTAMFFLMPFFAFLSYLFFMKKELYYVDHLILSLHLHSFIFCIFTVWLLLSEIWLSGWIMVIFLLWLSYYFFVAARRVYGYRWRKTILKGSLLIFIYNLFLVVILVFTFILSFLSM